MTTKFWRALAVAGAMAVSGTATAAPILGGQLVYTGGDVTITTLPVTSGFTTQLGLYEADRTLVANLGLFDEPAGVSITFNPGTLYGYLVGQELIFGIDIIGNNDVFVMGAASRNADNMRHATVDSIGGGQFIVGFEDLFGGGDQDYDDNKFRFEGGIVQAPAPLTGGLLLLGLAAAARRGRRA